MIGQSFPTATAETKETNIKQNYTIVFRDNKQMFISIDKKKMEELKNMMLFLTKPGFMTIGDSLINTRHILFIAPSMLYKANNQGDNHA